MIVAVAKLRTTNMSDIRPGMPGEIFWSVEEVFHELAGLAH